MINSTSLFFRSVLAVVIFSTGALYLKGQCANNNKIKVKFQGDCCVDGTFQVTLGDKSVSGTGEDCAYTDTDKAEVELEIDKTYTLSTSLTDGDRICSSHVSLQCGGCFTIFVDGEDRGQSVSLDAGDGPQSWSIIVGFPEDEGEAAGSSSGGLSLGGDCAGAGGGSRSTNHQAGFSMSLGNLDSGLGAGTLRGNVDLSSSFGVSLGSFGFASRSEGELAIKPSSGDFRQILGADALFDLQATGTNEVTVRVYKASDVTGMANDLFVTNGNAPYVTYVFKNAPNDLTRVELTRTVTGQNPEYSSADYDPATDETDLISGNLLSKTAETIDAQTQDRVVTETICEVVNGQVGQIFSKTQTRHRLYPLGERVVEVIEDPDVLALTTTYSYYFDIGIAANEGRYGELKHVIKPDGGWTKYEYNSQGRVEKVFTPWKDGPAHPDGATTQNCRVTRYGYRGNGGAHFRTSVSSTTTDILGTQVSRTSYLRSSRRVDGEMIEVSTTRRIGDGEPLESVSSSYRYDASPHLAGRSHSSESSDGTIVTFTHETGTLVGGVFTPDPEDIGEANRGVSRRSISTSGTKDSPEGIAMMTTRSVSIYQAEKLVRSETQVYTGDNAYETIDFTEYAYDGFGNLTETALNGNIISESTYSFDRLLSSTDAEGRETEYAYTGDGRILTETVVERVGQPDLVKTPEYDALGRVIGTTTTSGSLSQSSSTTYDALGRAGTSTNVNGMETTYTYAPALRQTTVSFPGGRSETVTKYLDGQTKSVIGNIGVPTYRDYSVDASGNQLTTVRIGSISSPRLTTTTSNRLGQTTRVETAGAGGTIVQQNAYDEAGRLASTESTGVSRVQYAYDELGRQVGLSRDVLGAGYSSLAETKKYYEKIDNSWFEISESWLFSENDIPTVQSRSLIQLTGLPAGVVSRATTESPGGEIATAEYSVDRANKTSMTITSSSSATATTQQAMVNGLVTSVSRSDVATPVTIAYDAFDRVISQVSPQREHASISYVPGSNQIHQITPTLSGTTTHTYYPPTHASAGQVKSVATGNRTVYFEYDSRGNLVRKWGSGTNPEEYVYDNYSQRTHLKTFRTPDIWDTDTWPASPGTPDTTTWDYHEASGQLLSKTDAAGRATTYLYHDHGQVSRRTWQRGVFADYSYSPNGLLSKIDYSDSTPDVAYTRNRLGQVISIVDATGVSKNHYAISGQLQTVDYTDGVLAGNQLEYSFDTYGRTEQVKVGRVGNPAYHQVDYSYDPASGRLATVEPAADWQISYGYSPTSGRQTTLTQKHQGSAFLTTTKDFDDIGRLSSITNQTATMPPSSHSYEFTSHNEREKATLQDGSFWDYEYDSRGQLTDAQKSLAPAQTVMGSVLEAEYDAAGNSIVQRKGGGHSGGVLRAYSNTVNQLNQITNRAVPGQIEVIGTSNAPSVTINGTAAERQGDTYALQVAVDNSISAKSVAVTISATSGADTVFKQRQRNIQAASQSYTYDLDGNLIDDGIWSYTWDAENRLVRAEYQLATTDAEKQRLRFVHDHQGRRILRQELRWSAQRNLWYAERQTKYLYDGWNVMVELLNENTLWKKHTWGVDLGDRGLEQAAGGVGGLLASENLLANYAAATAYDGAGNVTALVEKGSSNLLAEYEYTAFGRTLSQTGPHAADNLYRFSTKPHEDLLGWYYYGFRYYQPTTGRWLSRDPIGEDGGVNLYGFVGNDGVNRWDRLGLKWSSKNGQEALDLAMNVKGGIKVPDSHPCCDLLNGPRCVGGNCIEFAAGVIRCGYLISGSEADKEIARQIKNLSPFDGESLAKILDSDGWNGVVYLRDQFRIESSYTNPDTDPTPPGSSFVHGTAILGTLTTALNSGYLYGTKIVGGVYDLSPYGIRKENSYQHILSRMKDARTPQSRVNSEKFAFLNSANSYHTGIIAKGVVYDAPNLNAHNEGIRYWVEKYQATDSGYMMIAPDSTGGLGYYERKLEELRALPLPSIIDVKP